MSTFVAIPCYDDDDIAPTVASALGQAAGDVRVGVCLQTDDDACEASLRALGADVIRVPLDEARGCAWARSLAASLWGGEEWLLKCDAHHRFAPGWDAELAEQIRGIAHADGRAALTAYLPSPAGIADFQSQCCVMTAKGGWSVMGWGLQAETWAVQDAPLPSRFLSGHFLFAPAALWLAECPDDPWIQFAGEETSMGLRAWTNGWNLWHPRRNVATHRYGWDHPGLGPRMWDRNPRYGERDETARRRLHALYGFDRDGPPLGAYGLGHVRTRADWEAWARATLLERAEPTADWLRRNGVAFR